MKSTHATPASPANRQVPGVSVSRAIEHVTTSFEGDV